MKKETFISILRHVIGLLGAFLIGQTLFGTAIDHSIWETVTGIFLSVGSVVWSIADKTATIEMVQGVVRQVITFLGGLLIASGKLSEETFKLILGLATAMLPVLQSYLAKRKVQLVSDGSIPLQKLKQ